MARQQRNPDNFRKGTHPLEKEKVRPPWNRKAEFDKRAAAKVSENWSKRQRIWS